MPLLRSLHVRRHRPFRLLRYFVVVVFVVIALDVIALDVVITHAEPGNRRAAGEKKGAPQATRRGAGCPRLSRYPRRSARSGPETR